MLEYCAKSEKHPRSGLEMLKVRFNGSCDPGCRSASAEHRLHGSPQIRALLSHAFSATPLFGSVS